MRNILLFTFLIIFSITSYGQYRWEVTGGLTNSSLNLEDADTSRGSGFYFNAGYGYVMGVRAKTSIVFSIEALQRNSEIENVGDFKALQFGFNPKFRYLFNQGKSRFRPFVNVGPSFRLNANIEVDGVELENEDYEQLVIGGTYGVGFSQMIGEMFDVMLEVGAMNDFTDNLTDVESTFFDIYARVGVRFRIYDARR
ncbi:hypothetical protein GCM10022393_26520 [Aquimarina addita]|uniref:Outer membrane protein beta-barrel domain-containing protein n=1 Tax=Aquimarina addita TaxID=870485 RepID=A0ABP6UQ36_9FLAO